MTTTRKPDIAQIITPNQIKKIKKIIGAELQTPDQGGNFPKSTHAELVIMHQSSYVAHGFRHYFNGNLAYIYDLMSVRRILVDRSRTPQQMIDATGLVKYTDREVVESMPIGDGEVTDVYFFRYDRSGYPLDDEDVIVEYSRRGLIPCDPFSLAQVINNDPSLIKKGISTHWKNHEKKWCYVIFSLRHGDQCIFIDYSTGKWKDYGWFAGLPKDPKTAVLLKTIVKSWELFC